MSKKTKKKRGSKTHGYGGKKKHRGAGSRGGRGRAGSKDHKRSIYGLEGKKGFERPRKVKKEKPTINLKELDSKIEELLNQGLAKEKNGKIRVNLVNLGYDKLLGKGKLTHRLVVEGKEFSKKAKTKIEKKGGEVVGLS